MKKPSLLACLILLFFTRPALTEPTGSAQSPSAESQSEEKQRTDERLGIESRRRLRDELNVYSRKVYPDQEVEERRRMMLDRMEERLNSADKNGIGSITRSEAQLRMPRLARQFDQIDTNGDNVITREELQAARERAAQEKRETARADNPVGVEKPIKAQ